MTDRQSDLQLVDQNSWNEEYSCFGYNLHWSQHSSIWMYTVYPNRVHSKLYSGCVLTPWTARCWYRCLSDIKQADTYGYAPRTHYTSACKISLSFRCSHFHSMYRTGFKPAQIEHLNQTVTPKPHFKVIIYVVWKQSDKIASCSSSSMQQISTVSNALSTLSAILCLRQDFASFSEHSYIYWRDRLHEWTRNWKWILFCE